jgi:hypothetical protein
MSRKILVQDDDCHWYLIDESAKEEFLKWVEDIYNESYYEKDFSKCAINSYQNVKILDYVIE